MKKNILVILLSLGLVAFISINFDFLIENILENEALFFILALLSLGALIIFFTVKELMREYKTNPERTKKYIIQTLKHVGISLGIGFLIVGIIVFSILSQY